MFDPITREDWDTFDEDTKYDLYVIAHGERQRLRQYEQDADLALFLRDAGQYGDADVVTALSKAKGILWGYDEPVKYNVNDKVRHVIDGTVGIIGAVATKSNAVYVHWQTGETYWQEPGYLAHYKGGTE